ncbi:MAG: hypothetical protein HYZ51_01225 [Candidatus Doudnabacteria bacterium]|nr:hypothetical protein [Candidatus Doudnabacteria bacterium]
MDEGSIPLSRSITQQTSVSIGPTLKSQNELATKDQNWLAKNWHKTSMSWDEHHIQNPELLISHKISKSDNNDLYMSFVLPNYGLISDYPLKRNEWVQIDQIFQGRAQGHFGGTFEEPRSLRTIEV